MKSNPPKQMPKKFIFAMEWMKDRNATQAAIRAGYSARTAHTQGSRLLTDDEVQKFIAEKTEKIVATAEIDVARTLKEIHNGAFFDPAECYDENGLLLPVPQMPEAARRAIAQIKQEEIFEWQGEGKDRRRVWIGYAKQVKFVSKEGMLTLTARNLGILNDKVTVFDGDRVAKLDAAIARTRGSK